ncbi:hypothetical protein [Thalassovita sp.]|uniref:hypothetical protein n=1 Tax=Thalassovita sp. TaxID=1979401 RepID=UPI002B27B1CD|nr:hypothetical protein [Thalassovita sp.]
MKLFTVTKAHVLGLFTATRGLDEAAQATMKNNLNLWFADLPHTCGEYMLRDVVVTLRAHSDATTAQEITKLAAIDSAVAAGKAVPQ